jgi:hypothetical protein
MYGKWYIYETWLKGNNESEIDINNFNLISGINRDLNFNDEISQ